MTALVGRKVRLKTGTGVAAVGIVGAQNDGISMANGEVDITDKDDNGYRTLLDDWGVRSIDVNVEGILKSDQLITIATSSSAAVLLSDYELQVTGIGTFAGDFWMSSLSLGAPTAEGVTFTATFLSSGQYTYTAAP